MKVVVNRDLCVGHGVCEAAAPGLFAVGDDGISEVLVGEVGDDLVDTAAEAVAACPAQALRLQS